MDRILVLGYGHFGQKAAAKLKNCCEDITVADKQSGVLQLAKKHGFTTICGDAVKILAEEACPGFYRYIVPAVPVHVAYEWLLALLERSGATYRRLPVPTGLAVPNPYYLGGTLYTSLAGHLCPEDCPEPAGSCYVTGETRSDPLFNLLAQVNVPDYAVNVIRSRQLAPGVGGLLPEDLLALLRLSLQSKGNCLVATSCSCHAVVNGYQVIMKTA